MRFKQNLGIIGAVCSSFLLSVPAGAQTTPSGTNPPGSSMNAAEMERICTEYMNRNGNSAGMENNRTPASEASTDVVRDRTAEETTGSTSRSTSTSRTTRAGSMTSNPATSATTTGRSTTRPGSTMSDPARTSATTTSRTRTDTTQETTGSTTGERMGIGSFTAQELDRMCANFKPDSDSTTPSVTPSGSNRQTTTPSAAPGGSTRPTNPNAAPTNR